MQLRATEGPLRENASPGETTMTDIPVVEPELDFQVCVVWQISPGTEVELPWPLFLVKDVRRCHYHLVSPFLLELPNSLRRKNWEWPARLWVNCSFFRLCIN